MKVLMLDDIIQGRTVVICAHGASLNKLENQIEKFKDYDVCWTSLNLYTIIEVNILHKINKKLDIVLDSSTIANQLMKRFEAERRIPRLEQFLARPEKNLWITTEGLLRDQLRPLGYGDFLSKYQHKILVLDKVYRSMQAPNSISLLICAAAIGGAKKIVLFGYDGYWGNYQENINSFYRPEDIAIERKYAVGNTVDSDVAKDTTNFNSYFWNIYLKWCSTYDIKPVEVINCSPDSKYTIFPIFNYDNIHQVLIDA